MTGRRLPARRRARWRPSVLEAVLLLLLVGAAGWGLRSLGEMVERRVVAGREEAIGALFKLLNRNFSYGGVAPSLLRAIEIRDLTIYGAEAPDRPVVSIRRLRLRYSLARLIASRDPVAALREVQLADSHFTVDLQRDREMVQVLQEIGLVVGGAPAAAAGPAAGAGVPPVTLTGVNLGVTLQGRGGRLQVDDLFFRVQAGERLQVSARGRARAWPPATALGALGQHLDADFRVRGSAAEDLSAAQLSVRLNELNSGRFRAAPQDLQVSFSDDQLRVVRVDDRVPLQFTFSHQPSSGRSELAVAATGLNLADVAAFPERDPLLRVLQGAAVSGAARWSHDPAAGMAYEARLSGHLAGADTPPAALSLALRGDAARVEVSRLAVETAEGSLDFAGDVVLETLLPQGALAIRSLPVRPGQKLDFETSLTRGADGAMLLRSERLALADTVFRRFDLDLRPATAAPLTYRYQVRAELQQEEANFINGEGTVALGGDRRLELEASFDSIGAGLLYRLAAAPDARQPWLAGGLEPLLVSGAVDAVTDFESASLSAPALRVRDSAEPANRLQLSVTANERGLRLERAAAVWLGLELNGQAQLTRADGAGEAVDLAAEWTINDVPYEVRLRHTPGQGLTASGSYDLEFAADYGRGGLTFRGSSVRLPLPLPFAADPLEATLAFRGRFAGPEDWSLRSDAVTLHRLPLVGRTDLQLEARVQADAGGVAVEPLIIRDRDSELRGRGSIEFAAGSGVVAAQLTAAAADGGESYAAALDLAGSRVEASAAVRGLPLRRLGDFPVSGNLQLDVAAAGPWQDLSWEAALQLSEGRLNDEAVALEAAVERSAGGWELRGLTFDLLSHRLRDGRGTYRPESGRLEFAADYSAEFFGDPVTARLRLAADNHDAGAGVPLRAALAAGVSGQLSVEQIQSAGAALDPWRLRLRLAEQPAAGAGAGAATAERPELEIRFDGGPREAFAGRLSTAGGFALQVQPGPYPVHGSAAGTVAGGGIDAAVEIGQADALLINEVLSQAPVSLQAGTASGSVRVTGPINDPDFRGQVRLAGAVAASPLSPLPVGPFRALIDLDEKLATITGVAAEGSAALPIAVRGTATVERWVPAEFALDLTADGAGIPINYQFGPLLFDGMASGAVAVAGAPGTVTISGDLQAADAVVSLVDTEPGADDPELRVDLAVVTGRGVDFTWPSAQFPVVRLQLTPSKLVRIGYDGPSGNVSVQGELSARGGDLFYFDRQFLLREGQIRFAGDDGAVDPRLVVRAETRERDPDGEPVRIILQADTTLSQFGPEVVRLSSDPPQSALVLDALVRGPLAQGERADDGGAAGLSAAAFSGELMAQVALLRPVERALREALGVDMLSIRSQFVQTLVQDVVGASVSGGITPGTGNPLDNTSLSFGKYLGSDLFLTMLLRLSAPGGPNDDIPLVRDVELGLEWATPFFLLEWSFLPRNLNTLFVTDNTISLRWRWSY